MFPGALSSFVLLGQNYPDPFFQLAILFGGFVLLVVYVVLAIVLGIALLVLAFSILIAFSPGNSLIPSTGDVIPPARAQRQSRLVAMGMLALALAIGTLSLAALVSPCFVEGGLFGWGGVKWKMHQQTEPMFNAMLSLLLGVLIAGAALVPAVVGCVVLGVRRFRFSRTADRATPA